MDVLPCTPHNYRGQLALSLQFNPQMHPAPYGPGKACMQVRPAVIVAAGRKSWASIVFVANCLTSCLTRIYGDGHRTHPMRVVVFFFSFSFFVLYCVQDNNWPSGHCMMQGLIYISDFK